MISYVIRYIFKLLEGSISGMFSVPSRTFAGNRTFQFPSRNHHKIGG